MESKVTVLNFFLSQLEHLLQEFRSLQDTLAEVGNIKYSWHETLCMKFSYRKFYAKKCFLQTSHMHTTLTRQLYGIVCLSNKLLVKLPSNSKSFEDYMWSSLQTKERYKQGSGGVTELTKTLAQVCSCYLVTTGLKWPA